MLTFIEHYFRNRRFRARVVKKCNSLNTVNTLSESVILENEVSQGGVLSIKVIYYVSKIISL